ncbi:SRPBCC family protein [Streptomyces sp. NRRL S-350]|uniref:SRPBCC family protein n=1 Tax=Streptomyces sp. NRRL S-350 TaxID=1463902 RepID=UPI0004BEDAA4|nr:SRPBCC family protein [Streptomyces sp. NRRL S-350]
MSRSRSTRARARAALLSTPLALALLGAAAAPAGAAGAAGAAPAHRGTSLTCRGAGVDPDARVRYRTEAVIHAPLRTVWKLQTDVTHWPSWQAPVATAERLDPGPLRKGSAFHWTTPLPPNPATAAPSLDITSTVRQLRPGSCIRWTGPAVAEGLHIDGVHVWNFTEVDGGVLVRTEETHTGPQVDANVPAATAILRQGLEGWLHDLKTAAEARTPHRPN